MQRFLVHTIGNTIHLQASQIMRNTIVYVFNKHGKRVFINEINNTDFMHVKTQLPSGHYKLHVMENNVEWSKDIILDQIEIE